MVALERRVLMTAHDDAKKIMSKYRFVTKEKRDFVMETLELTIKNYDTLTIICFEFDAPKYDGYIVDLFKKAKTIDDVVEIHNQVAEILTQLAELTKTVEFEVAKHTTKKRMRKFITKHGGEDK